MEFAAPYPAIQTISIIPNPAFSNTEALTDSLSVKRATDGTMYTYVKTKAGRRKMTWQFRLTRPKSLELRAFFLSYHSQRIQVTDHDSRVWIGNFTNNPFEFESSRRAAPVITTGGATDVKGETVEITVEFEGIEQ